MHAVVIIIIIAQFSPNTPPPEMLTIKPKALPAFRHDQKSHPQAVNPG